MNLHQDAHDIITAALAAAQPGQAVRQALQTLPPVRGKLLLVAIGKAAWEMAQAANQLLGDRISGGIVITKHGHSRGAIGRLQIREAGHPIPDDDTYRATAEALALTEGLEPEDLVVFCVSGGGSALFEQPLLPQEELAAITSRLLACGADITEMNTVRKRLSAVKGGRFAAHCAPAQVFSILLSDVLGDRPDSIASGPAYPDASTCQQALRVAQTYALPLSDRAKALLNTETPKTLPHVQTQIAGSVRQLCRAAETVCRSKGYDVLFLTDRLCCEAREAGSFLASIARSHASPNRPLAILAGGETVVHLHGTGKGGRNQELCLAAAQQLDGMPGALLFSLGSDGTDGPTDAAGGIVDGTTAETIRAHGISPEQALADNDAYHALQAADALLMTGPTGTNVNDLTVLLLQ